MKSWPNPIILITGNVAFCGPVIFSGNTKVNNLPKSNVMSYLLKANIIISIFIFSIVGYANEKLSTFNQERLRNLALSKLDSEVRSFKNTGDCTVVQRIEMPDIESQGLAWDQSSGTLWNSQDIAKSDIADILRISQINLSGRILSTFSAPGDGPKGLVLIGNDLFNLDFLEDKIFRLGKQGEIINEIDLELGLNTGLAWDNSYFWITDWLDELIIKIDPQTGKAISSFKSPQLPNTQIQQVPYGLAFDGSDLWVSSSDGIFKVDRNTGSVLVSCTDFDFRYGKAFGLTWDGEYLWGGSWIGDEIIRIAVPPVRDNPSDLPFVDVPLGYWAYSGIARLFESNITGGCSLIPSRYCPTSDVTRAQMAVFIGKGLNGSNFSPPAATGNQFFDVPSDYWAAPWIEQFVRDGITGGCGNGNYCPDMPVTREQMAVFLLRTLSGPDYTPPAAQGTFDDVPQTHWSAPWIEELSRRNITGGCGNNKFCPTLTVTRDQMAVFLTRIFNL